MTEEEQVSFAATLGAYDRVLVMLLRHYLDALPDDERARQIEMLTSPAGLPTGRVLDIGAADTLAGFALKMHDVLAGLVARCSQG